jgi:hypothetical protein
MAKSKAGSSVQGVFDPEKYQYTECREQHHWVPYDGAIDVKAQIAFRVQRCSNCTMRKYTQISLYPKDYGQLLSSYYKQPPGYRIPGGIGPAERGQIRVHNFMAEVKAASAAKSSK